MMPASFRIKFPFTETWAGHPHPVLLSLFLWWNCVCDIKGGASLSGTLPRTWLMSFIPAFGQETQGG